MWNVIVLKWDSFVLSVGSILYGLQLYMFPSILQNFKVYDIIDEMFDNKSIGLLFIVAGLMKLIGIVLSSHKLKFLSVRALIFLWLLFMVSFIITAPVNTIWIMAFMATALGLGIIIREE